jgi:hypothetical protein
VDSDIAGDAVVPQDAILAQPTKPKGQRGPAFHDFWRIVLRADPAA